jgi:hypothetical protein
VVDPIFYITPSYSITTPIRVIKTTPKSKLFQESEKKFPPKAINFKILSVVKIIKNIFFHIKKKKHNNF